MLGRVWHRRLYDRNVSPLHSGQFLGKSKSVFFTFESGGEKVDVVRLIFADLLEVLIENRVVPGIDKVHFRELGKSLAVEGILKMLQCQRVVENVGCAILRQLKNKTKRWVYVYIPSVAWFSATGAARVWARQALRTATLAMK
jgi:hypothetical protein